MRRGLKLTGFALSLAVLLIGGYISYIWATGNFHSITSGEAYRSAQLNRNELERYVIKYRIKSILNLRGEDSEASWYKDEIRKSAKLGVLHYDIQLWASRYPDDKTIDKLIGILRTAPRPILLHCQGGADRAGLVSAMWKVIVDNEPKAEAKKQLSFLYGHVPILGRDTMDRFFEKWNPTDQFSH